MGYGRQKFRPEIRRAIPGVTSRLSRRLPRFTAVQNNSE